LYRTGPIHFTKSFLFVSQFLNDSFIALPTSYLYPLGYYHARAKNLYSYAGEESLGLHYWAGTWYIKKD
jgi:hypothetical protein